jgi:hypothetical protein
MRGGPAEIYRTLADGVRQHALVPMADVALDAPVTILTRYTTRLWFGTVVTTEEATLDPGRSVLWRHVDGPLTGSVETFRIEPRSAGGALITYDGEIRARHPLFRGPLDRLFVAPSTKRVSMAALRALRAKVDGV